jgi:hypothetical protein
MYARVARFEGASADDLRSAAEEINARAATGPPEGVDSVGFTLLIDPENGTALGIGLFETEDKLREGSAVLDAMTPPGNGMGHRVSVETYEVGVEVRM